MPAPPIGGARPSGSGSRDPKGFGQAPPGSNAVSFEVVRARFEHWREMMGPVREAACRLEAAGAIEILQKGKVVEPSRARGPIRLRRVE